MPPAGLRRLTALLVEYEGDSFLHERKILAFLPDDTLLVLTPHGLALEERMDSYARIYVRGTKGELPARWNQPGNRGHTVLFNDEYWQTRKDAIAAEWRIRYPSPRHGSLEAARAPVSARGDADAGRLVDGTVTPDGSQDARSVADELPLAGLARVTVDGGGGGVGGGGHYGEWIGGGGAAGAKERGT